MSHRILMALIILFLLSPFFLLFSQFNFHFHLDLDNFYWAFKNTLIQSIGSGIASVVFGGLGGFGLLWISRVVNPRTFFWLEKLILLPNMLPSLFVIVSCLGFINPFPYGKLGIILIHTIINIGLVSVLFSQIVVKKLSAMGSLSLVEGASRWQFFRVGILGYLTPDIFFLFLFVFAISIVSFNVPLLVGGSSGTTLEVLIYENLVITRNWSESIILCVLQMTIVGLVSFLRKPTNIGMSEERESQMLELVEWKWGLTFPFLALVLVLVSPLLAISNGLRQLHFLEIQWSFLIQPILNSFLIGLFTGICLFCLTSFACFGFELRWWRRFLLFYLPPGAVLVGFSFFILAKWIEFSVNTQIILGLSLLFFASSFRLSLASSLSHLLPQIEVAQILGAKPVKIFKELIFPQMIKQLVFASGVGSMWSCGDFALSSILSSEDFHLALIIKSLAASYRLDAAQLLMFILYGVALILFLLWWRLGNVISRKLNC